MYFLTSQQVHTHVVTMTCYLIKRVEAFHIQNKSAECAAKAVDSLILPFTVDPRLSKLGLFKPSIIQIEFHEQ